MRKKYRKRAAACILFVPKSEKERKRERETTFTVKKTERKRVCLPG